MAFKKDAEFVYTAKDEIVIEEKGNKYIKLAMIAWKSEEDATEDDYRLDIRKYMTNPDATERMNKGVSFMTKDGPNELVNVMVERGYGDTTKVLTSLKERSDFSDAVKEAYGEKAEDIDDSFDLREFL